MKQSIVWLDGFIGDDDIIYGIGTFVGAGGELARQIISVGGRIGFSTSGFGDFLPDGVEIDPDEYEIDRFADLVLNPSQGVFGDYKDTIKPLKQSVNKELKENKLRLKEDEDITLDETEESTENTNEELTEETSENKSEETVNESTDDSNTSENPENENAEDTAPATPEEEDEITLSEELVVKHYSEAIKNISKESNKLWESKIENLEGLVSKIKKENLTRSSKQKLNKQINKLVETIKNDTRKAIQEGYSARELCKELDILDITKLSGIKEKLEDFSSLEECLDRSTKEATKYKQLYEAKQKYAITEAENSFKFEEQNEKLQENVKTLKAKLEESQISQAKLKAHLNEVEKIASQVKPLKSSQTQIIAEKASLQKKVLNLQEFVVKSRQQASRIRILENDLRDVSSSEAKLLNEKKVLQSQLAVLKETQIRNRQLKEEVNQLKDLLQEAEKTISVITKKNRNLLRDKKEFQDSNSIFRDTAGITDFLGEAGVGSSEEYKDARTMRQAQDKLLYSPDFTEDILGDEAEHFRANIRTPKEEISSLNELFN